MKKRIIQFLLLVMILQIIIIVLPAALAAAGSSVSQPEASQRPGFVYVQGTKLMVDGHPFFSKGANWLGGRYIKRWTTITINGTEHYGNGMYLLDGYYNATALDLELKELRTLLDVNTLRLPVVAGVNSDGTIIPHYGERLKEFTKIAYRNGIRIHWVFFFGHGQWKCPLPNGTMVPCDPRAKPDIGNATFYPPGSDDEKYLLNIIRTTVPYLRDEPGVISYEVGNEILLNGIVRAPGYQEQVLSYLTRMLRQIKKYDPNHLVASGEVTVIQNSSDYRWPWLESKGVEFLKFADIHNLNNGQPFSYDDIVDYHSPHMYMSGNVVNTAVDVLLANTQKPILFGEYGGGGVSTFYQNGYLKYDLTKFANEEEQAIYQAPIISEAKSRLNGLWVWNPTPFIDLKPGTFSVYSWLDRSGNKRPIIVFNNPPRRIKTLSLAHWTVAYQDNALNTLRLMKAASLLANRNAEFVSQEVPATMIAGQTYPVAITMRNSGETTWEFSGKLKKFSYVLGAQNLHDNAIWGGRIDVPTPVKPGQTVTVRANIKAPENPGTYNFQYKMLQTGVEWFGQPTPNLVVRVETKPTSSLVCYESDIGLNIYVKGYTEMRSANGNDASKRIYDSCALRNADVPNCKPGPDCQVREQYCDFASNQRGESIQSCPTGCDDGKCIKPGTVCGNNICEEGENGEDTSKGGLCIQDCKNDAKFVEQVVPEKMVAGQKYTVILAFRNIGQSIWNKIGSAGDYGYAYRIKTASPYDNANWATTFVPLQNIPVRPQEDAIFEFTILAPKTSGTYDFQWQMNQGWVGWFGEPSQVVKVEVVENTDWQDTDRTAKQVSTGRETASETV